MEYLRIGLRRRHLVLAAILLSAFAIILASRASRASFTRATRSPDYIIYADSLKAGWRDESWNTTVDLASSIRVHDGARSLAATHSAAWVGLKLRTDEVLTTSDYGGLSFWAHGGDGGQVLDVVVKDGADVDSTIGRIELTSAWQQITLDFTSIAVPDTLSGVMLVNTRFGAQPTYFIDSLMFTTNGSLADTVVIYDEALNADFGNWSWGTNINFQNTSTKHSGTYSMRADYGAQWNGIFLHANELLETVHHEQVTVWLRGGSGGETVRLTLADESGTDLSGAEITLTNGWKKYSYPLSTLGSPSAISGIKFMNTAPGGQTVYIDDLQIEAGAGDGGNGGIQPPPPATASYNLTVNLAATTHTISEDIYGINFGDEALMNSLGSTVRRWGGNAVTRYNWQLDVSHRASDWYFLNYPNQGINVANLPHGSSSDQFVQTNRAAGVNTIMTIPTIGWTAKSRDFDCGFSVAKYGAQQATEPYNPDCGNGIRPNGTPITGVDPRDTSKEIDTQFVKDWIGHLRSNFGSATGNGVRYYALDNEPFLWNHTHRDVRPNPVGYDELRDRAYLYGAAIKQADPNAKVLGPVLWGYTAYLYSGIDAASGNWDNPPDRLAHGDVPLVEWYLAEMQKYENLNGQRILDYLDLHFYPQAGGVALQTAGNTATQELRLRSTRSLWDRSYADESWISDPVFLIPQMRDWVNDNYPGTKLALSEYNWGGLEHINGAIAQADVLGIFGRERLDLATMWDPPAANQPGAFAFRMYRNYDGLGSKFGELALSASSQDQSKLAIYAARRGSDGRVTVMVVNKAMASVQGNINLLGMSGGLTPVEVYQYSQDDLRNIHPDTTTISPNGTLSFTFRANSITLFELPNSPNTDPLQKNFLPIVLKAKN